ncbi:MAG TPA: hypothetical protein VK737_06495, partial [Opitutales bacterium]|nr:hypothetical protein [Opitutales bacterium]
MAIRSNSRIWFRHLAVLICYSGLLIFSFYLAYELRFNFEVPEDAHFARRHQLLWVLPGELMLLYTCGQFRGFLSYFRMPDLARLVTALGIGTTIQLAMYIAFNWLNKSRGWVIAPPLAVIFGNYLIATQVLSGFRIWLRTYREGQPTAHSVKNGSKQRLVAIVGAGEVGSAVAADLLAKRGLGLKPVAFFDDNEAKHGHDIHGIPVVGPPDQMEVAREAYDFDQIIIALPAGA